jgi:predicted metal-dependent peptidase
MLQIGKQLTPEQRLSKAVVDIMGSPKYVALAGILMIGDRKIINDPLEKGGCDTACTNGKHEWYYRDFIEKLNDAELRFLVLHENYHKLYKHLTTWKHLVQDDAERSNVAMDMVINAKLVADNEDGFATMTGELEKGCYDKKYIGWDTARVYHDLPNKQKRGKGGSGSLPDGFDVHDHKGADELTPDEKKELARDLDEAIRQGAMVAGKTGSGGDRELGDLLKPQIDWKQVLREFVTTTCRGKDYSTWNRPNRRFIGQNIYMPSGISEKVDELVLAIDTSGSIGTRELNIFLSEVKGICDTVKPDTVRILYWDTEVCADEEYKQHEVANIVHSTKPDGGGGTMVECVPQYMAEKSIKPQACIVLTDGYLGGDWGTWTCPILWCIIDNDVVPSVGKYVHVNSYDL